MSDHDRAPIGLAWLRLHAGIKALTAFGRGAGYSYRAIAGAVGVSNATIHRDLSVTNVTERKTKGPLGAARAIAIAPLRGRWG